MNQKYFWIGYMTHIAFLILLTMLEIVGIYLAGGFFLIFLYALCSMTIEDKSGTKYGIPELDPNDYARLAFMLAAAYGWIKWFGIIDYLM